VRFSAILLRFRRAEHYKLIAIKAEKKLKIQIMRLQLYVVKAIEVMRFSLLQITQSWRCKNCCDSEGL